jgi:SAM-dependent methyltransferase
MDPYIKLPDAPITIGRKAWILDRCRGKRILHVGCADIGMLEERFEKGETMHQELAGVTQTLWGIDIEPKGIKYLRSMGFGNLLVADACNAEDLSCLAGKDFDVILATELLEHLLNPGLFLHAVKSLMKPGTTELIVTVPNAFRLDNFRWLLEGIEFIHPDHNYWFSYVTLTNLVRKSNYEIVDLRVYSFRNDDLGLPVPRATNLTNTLAFFCSRPRIKTIVKKIKSVPLRLAAWLLYRRSPFFADGLIIVARLPGH